MHYCTIKLRIGLFINNGRLHKYQAYIGFCQSSLLYVKVSFNWQKFKHYLLDVFLIDCIFPNHLYFIRKGLLWLPFTNKHTPRVS
jgi:hypothetical protein